MQHIELFIFLSDIAAKWILVFSENPTLVKFHFLPPVRDDEMSGISVRDVNFSYSEKKPWLPLYLHSPSIFTSQTKFLVDCPAGGCAPPDLPFPVGLRPPKIDNPEMSMEFPSSI